MLTVTSSAYDHMPASKSPFASFADCGSEDGIGQDGKILIKSTFIDE